MNTPEALEGMVDKLIRRGLPAEYAYRAVAEFADHHRDLVEELQAGDCSEFRAEEEASQRLGDSRTLLKKTVREYESRYWCARWPLLTFLLGPVALLVGVCFTINLCAFCIVWPLHSFGVINDQFDGILSSAERLQIYALQAIHLFIAPAIVMVILSWRARRAALNYAWIAMSATILSLLLVTIRCGIPEPIPPMFNADGTTLPADRFLWLMNVPRSWSELVTWINWTHVQSVVPILIFAVFAIRGAYLSRLKLRSLQHC